MKALTARSAWTPVLVTLAALVQGCTSDKHSAPVKPPETEARPVTQDLRARVVADLTAIHTALDHFATNNAGQYPDTLEKLVLPDMNGHRYLPQKDLPRDPWNRLYVYDSSAPANVKTLGADGRPGGTGDDADVDYASIAR
jgi:hypothetical protein